MFLLDTSFIIQLFRHPEKVQEYIPEINKEGATTSAISYYEIFRNKTKMSKKEITIFTRLV